MSTNSTIRIKRKDGTETGITCHFDGYLENVGVTLQLAYNTADKVEELLKLGNLSSLGYYLDSTKGDMYCIAYHRDKGEKFYQTNCSNEYEYTFVEEEAVWYVTRPTGDIESIGCKKLKVGYSPYVVSTNFLIDEIKKCNFDGWQDDEFAKSGEVYEKCFEKAYEARKSIIKAKDEEYEAYYRAYCL